MSVRLEGTYPARKIKEDRICAFQCVDKQGVLIKNNIEVVRTLKLSGFMYLSKQFRGLIIYQINCPKKVARISTDLKILYDAYLDV